MMKGISKLRAILVMTLVALGGNAQAQYGDMSQEDMQKMMGNIMQGAQEIQACIAKVDQAAIEKLMGEGEQLEAEVRTLCRDGKRARAQSTALDYIARVNRDPNLQELRNCGEMAQKMMPEVSFGYDRGNEEPIGDKHHVCDNFDQD